MSLILTVAERAELRKFQKIFGDKPRYVRVTVILLLDMGKSAVEIGEYLGIDENTDYKNELVTLLTLNFSAFNSNFKT